MDFLTTAYPWLKAFHIIAVIAWMAGLLYMPRLFVYHADAPVVSPQSEIFKIMERRLMLGIIIPALILTLIFGGALISVPGLVDWHLGWIHTKLLLVFGLLIYTHFLAKWMLGFRRGTNRHDAKFFRIMNEVPTVVMIAIVILVVVKPF